MQTGSMNESSDSDLDESFHDAEEYVPKPGKVVHLESGIEESKAAVALFMNNRFDEARSLMTPWSDESMYHALGSGVFEFLQAVLTFEPQHIDSASEALERSVEVCGRYRKKSSMYESLGKMVKKPNYDVLSEEEIHAELCYAECLLLRAVLTFIEDENLMSFVKGGLRMRSCLNAYKECWNILKNRNWKDCKHKSHFESGVRMGVGAYNLLISMLPARIMKLLEFIGFAGNRETGLEQLAIGNSLTGSVRQILCAMVLLGYHLFVIYVLGYGQGDIVLAQKIVDEQLVEYPDGVWYNFFKARLEYVKGNIEDAIQWYYRAWESQNDWIQFHHLCYWELMWSNCFLEDWSSARDFATLLFMESRWSKTIYGYQKAAFMCMLADKLSFEESQELNTLFKEIPSWKQRIAGKSIPMEKFAVKKCERFFAQDNYLVLPAVELMYLWNGFKIVGKRPTLIKSFLILVNKTANFVKTYKTGGLYYVDNLSLLELLRGVCLGHLGKGEEADEALRRVLAAEKELEIDHYLVPYATYELGISQWRQGRRENALMFLENAKNNFKGYALESRLHFRIHSAIADLKNGRKSKDSCASVMSGNFNSNGKVSSRGISSESKRLASPVL